MESSHTPHTAHGSTAAISHAHAAPTGFIRKYIFSLDHKVIGLQYFFLALAAVFVGMFLSLLMRIHLIWPTAVLPLVGEIKPETYLSLLTMHGTIMVFFVLTTAPQSGFGNYFLPIQIGAPDMAFPVLNMLSFWTTFLAFVAMIAAFFVSGGAPLHGWTGYAPLSALPSAGPGEQLCADLWVISIAVFCVASLMGALNFITTLLDLRAKGMTLFRLPLTCWAWFVTAILTLLAFGVLLSAGILLLLDRNLGTCFFVTFVVVVGKVIGPQSADPLPFTDAVRDRLCVVVRVRRPERTIPGTAGAGYSAARHVLCGWPLSPHYGCRCDLRHLRRNILLVSKNVWPHDE